MTAYDSCKNINKLYLGLFFFPFQNFPLFVAFVLRSTKVAHYWNFKEKNVKSEKSKIKLDMRKEKDENKNSFTSLFLLEYYYNYIYFF